MKRKDVWVSAEAPQPTAPAPATRPAPTVELVSGKVLDNLWGGVGVAVALSALYALARIALAKLGILGLPDWEHAAWMALSFALVGLLAFGSLTAWRASLDERERQGDINTLRDNEKAMLADIKELVSQRDEYKRLYQNAQDDIAEMRRSLHASMANASQRYRQPEEEVEAEAERNAKFLLNLAYRGEKWGRDRIVQTYGNWTPTMWTEARNLLELAGIVRTVGRTTELLKPDYSTAVVALAAYCHVDQSES